MRVSRRRRGLRVTEQFADDWQSEARAGADGRERVPKIVNPQALQAGVTLNSLVARGGKKDEHGE